MSVKRLLLLAALVPFAFLGYRAWHSKYESIPADALRLKLRLVQNPDYFEVTLENRSGRNLKVEANPEEFQGNIIVVAGDGEESKIFERKYLNRCLTSIWLDPTIRMANGSEIVWRLPCQGLLDLHREHLSIHDLDGAWAYAKSYRILAVLSADHYEIPGDDLQTPRIKLKIKPAGAATRTEVETPHGQTFLDRFGLRAASLGCLAVILALVSLVFRKRNINTVVYLTLLGIVCAGIADGEVDPIWLWYAFRDGGSSLGGILAWGLAFVLLVVALIFRKCHVRLVLAIALIACAAAFTCAWMGDGVIDLNMLSNGWFDFVRAWLPLGIILPCAGAGLILVGISALVVRIRGRGNQPD